MIEDEADMPPFHARGMTETVDAGSAVPLVLRLAADRVPDATGLQGAILDDDGTELAAAPFAGQADGWHVTAPITMTMPSEPGEHAWRAVLRAEAAGEQDEEAEVFAIHTLRFAVCTHTLHAVVWDVPSAVEVGHRVRLRVGLRCSAGCCTAGWSFVLRDDQGRRVAEGTVGADPWPGTTALHHAEVEIDAPRTEGVHLWTLDGRAPDDAQPHAARLADLRLRTVPAARHTLQVRAVDARTGAPVPRAKVVAHPYRTVTDDQGLATLNLAEGDYTVFVSGKTYFAYRTQGRIEGDLSITAELILDREFSEADAWA